MSRTQCVITSYSIHYTKLYEAFTGRPYRESPFLDACPGHNAAQLYKLKLTAVDKSYRVPVFLYDDGTHGNVSVADYFIPCFSVGSVAIISAIIKVLQYQSARLKQDAASEDSR